MEMNYKPNSHKSKEEQAAGEERKKLDKIVSGTVKTKKKGAFRQFIGDFFADTTSNLKGYIVKDVIIPNIKKGISDSIDIILNGNTQRTRGAANKISYRSYYDEPRTRNDTAVRTAYNYDDIILESRGEAEAVISQMQDLIDTYQMVSVADLYDLVGISGNYTDNKYGWTNIRNADVVRVRDGYALRLPKALPIK